MISSQNRTRSSSRAFQKDVYSRLIKALKKFASCLSFLKSNIQVLAQGTTFSPQASKRRHVLEENAVLKSKGL